MSDQIRLGLWLDDLRLGIKNGLKAVAPLGVEAVGLDAFSAELAPRTLGQTGRRDLARMIRSKGATLGALSADVGGRRLADPATLDGNLQRLREALQLAADLGAACLVVTGGYIPPPSPAPAAQASEDQAARAALTEGARAIANFAASCCARVCWQAGSEPPAVLAEFLSQADPGGLLAVDLNPGAYVMRGHDPLQALQALAARIGVVRAADCYRGGGEALFGQGDVRWGELIVGLATLQRQTPVSLLAGCSLECDRAAALTAAYRRLVALRGNPMG